MKLPSLILGALLALGAGFALGADAGEEGAKKESATGARVKSDAKDLGHGVAKAAKDVGHQVGTGTKKTVKSIKKKVQSDVEQGTPGDGSARRQNEKSPTSKQGRQSP